MNKLTVAVAAFAFATLGAATTTFAQPAQGPYGMAGCGLGSIVFGNKPGLVQIFAATTNGTFASQTFGITSGTSNCVSSEAPTVQVASFVQTNRPVLAKDMARGQGETIASLTTLAGCESPQAVGRTLQQNFRTVFPSAGVSDVEVSEAVISVLRDDASLACSKIL